MKKRCDTKWLTIYCPMCPEICNKLGFDVWKERSHTEEEFSCFVNVLSLFLCEDYIINYYAKLLMRTVVKKESKIPEFSFALYAKDEIFQQSNCTSGILFEGEFYSVENTSCMGTRLKCLWPKLVKPLISQSTSQEVSMTLLLIRRIWTFTSKCMQSMMMIQTMVSSS